MGFASYFSLLTALLFGLAWVGIVIFLRLRKKKSPMQLLFLTVFYIYIFKVLDYTLFQFQALLLSKLFIPNLVLHGQAAGEELNFVPLLSLDASDMATSFLNILMMVPFGFGLPFITDFRAKRVVVAGCILSVTIELMQFATGSMAGMTFRVADINDVIFNTTGVAIGYALFIGFMHVWQRIPLSHAISSNSFARYISERPHAKTP